MLCCNDESTRSYDPVRTNENTNDGPITTLHSTTAVSTFPGMHKRTSSDLPPSDCMLVKTGGNALQAIPKNKVLSQDHNIMVAVSVPENVEPGQEILVKAPNGESKRVTVPQGALPGHTFLVEFPKGQEQSSESPTVAVGIPVEQQDLLLMNQEEIDAAAAVSKDTSTANATVVGTPVIQDASQQTVSVPPTETQVQQQQQDASNAATTEDNSHQQEYEPDRHGRILIHIPPGARPGDSIQVKLVDGRTLQATVPVGESSNQFYVKVPPKQQNWHDNPLAYGAPMIAGPMLL